MRAPSILSIRSNTDDTLRFCGTILDAVEANQSVYLDLENIQVITSDAIAYILSILQYVRDTGRPVAIGGNVPSNVHCNNTLSASGFYKFVYSRGNPIITPNDDMFAIESGTKVDPKRAAEIRAFTESRLGSPSQASLRRLYETIIECMGNTHNHAYTGRKKQRNRWWLMASFERARQVVVYTFIDNGLGIPATVRRNFPDVLQELFIGDLMGATDSRLIKSALLGEFRTRTNLAYRGKGLPSIQHALDNGLIQRLQVISNAGIADDTESQRRLEEPFRGTMVAWEICNQVVNVPR